MCISIHVPIMAIPGIFIACSNDPAFVSLRTSEKVHSQTSYSINADLNLATYIILIIHVHGMSSKRCYGYCHCNQEGNEKEQREIRRWLRGETRERRRAELRREVNGKEDGEGEREEMGIWMWEKGDEMEVHKGVTREVTEVVASLCANEK